MKIQICPICDQAMTENVYYIPDINQHVCEECLEIFYDSSGGSEEYEDIQDYMEKNNIEKMPLENYAENYSPDNEDELFEISKENRRENF